MMPMMTWKGPEGWGMGGRGRGGQPLTQGKTCKGLCQPFYSFCPTQSPCPCTYLALLPLPSGGDDDDDDIDDDDPDSPP